MSCNPCCCLKLKDAAVTIGIWSTIYALAQIAIFGWQFSVLAQCQHVIMAQSNLQCDYYCPCVGASTARTSAIIEGKSLPNMANIFSFFLPKKCSLLLLPLFPILLIPPPNRPQIYSIMQLGIFGWQMAAIKYEKDRAANTLLPNYNTYGRYDIPTYYESYWQSPEERYYTWLFVIQILCLISAFFLLFASVMMIYGVHTWSRYLLVPWMVTMCASILTSLAYCIMWWAGDVRDYWLMLTIVEMFGVFLNTYFFVVIAVFHRRMLAELEYYARRRKYDRFSQQRETPQHTMEQRLDESGDEFGHPKQMGPPAYRRPPAGQFPYQPSPPPQPMPPFGTGGSPRQFLQQRTPMERFQEEAAIPAPPPPIEAEKEFIMRERPRSALDRTFPSQYDEFRRRRPSSQRQRQKCRHCGRECPHGGHGHHRGCHREYCHCHQPTKHRKYSCSSICSTANFDISDEEHFRRRRKSGGKRRERGHWSDQEESDLSEFVPSIQSEHNYGNIGAMERQRRGQGSRRRRRSGEKWTRRAQGQIDQREQHFPRGTLPRPNSQQFLASPHQGLSIPQHIVIPPMAADGTGDSQAERQYRINSEITISYDPQRGIQSPMGNAPPAIPPRRLAPSNAFGSIRGPPRQPPSSHPHLSITSNV